MMRRLWPATAEIPFNPGPFDPKELLRAALQRVHLEEPILALYHRIKGDAPGLDA